MSVRTTNAAVQKIIEVDTGIVENDDDMSPFIETASALVDQVCATSTQADGVTPFYTSTMLELIERWLAAHFYAVRDKRASAEKAGSVSVNYESKVDLYLANTSYGQQAMMLDIRGGLAALNRLPTMAGRVNAGVMYIGTPPCSSSTP